MGACSHAESAADSYAVRSSSLQESSSTSLSSNAPVNETVTFTMHVMHQDGTGKQIQLTTNASNLADALLEQGWIAGEQSQYGLFVTEVDGEKAEKAAWWKLQINGEDAQTGVSSIQPEATMPSTHGPMSSKSRTLLYDACFGALYGALMFALKMAMTPAQY